MRPGAAKGWRGLACSWRLWGLLGLALLALNFAAAPLILRLVMVPATQGRPGWMLESFGNEYLQQPPRRVALTPALARLELERPGSSFSAYGLWQAPVSGRYTFLLLCDDYAGLGLDGRSLFKMDPEIAALNLAEVVVEAEAGPHLLRLDLHNATEKGFLVVLVTAPGQADPVLLMGGQALGPDLSNIYSWWRVLDGSRWLWLPAAAALIWAAWLLVLPHTVEDRPTAFLWACLVLAAPALLLPGPPPQKAAFDDRGIRQRLQTEQPDYVFIGNSIVESQIDTQRLGQLLGGARVSTVITYGGLTAYDYLMFKNFVLASGAKPKLVFFTFRGTTPTLPRMRTEGEFLPTLQSMSHEDEPVFAEVMQGCQTWGQRLGLRLTRWLPVNGYQPQVRAGVDQAALFLTIPPLPGNKPDKWRGRLKDTLNDRFALDLLRGGAADLVETRDEQATQNQYDFDGAVAASFLPRIIELARDKGVGVVFMRAQERPTEQGPPPQDPRMALYLERLRAYLSERGVPFHDFTGDPEITLPMYAAGDHIGDRTRYTEILYERMAGVFK